MRAGHLLDGESQQGPGNSNMVSKHRPAAARLDPQPPPIPYTSHEGLNLTNQKSRKLGVFGRKLEGSQSSFCCKLARYDRKFNNYIQYELIGYQKYNPQP